MDSSIKILQITDCHLQQTPETDYKSFYPDQRLDAVVESIKQRFAAPSCFDYLLLTGDLAHYSAKPVYQRLIDKTQHLAMNVKWLPGNHDDTVVMYGFENMQQRVTIIGNWAIVMLDSTSNPNGVGSGELSENELDFLGNINSIINDTSHTVQVEHIMLVLHHPPIDVNSTWQDAIKLANSEAFWSIVENNSAVKAIAFGHLHQEHHIQKAGIQLFCTPATAPQFKKAQQTPLLEDDPGLSGPGYRTFELHENGAIDTQVYRVIE